MASRKILSSQQSLDLLLQGAKLAADFIMQTMGPGGKFVGLASNEGMSHFRVTKDGANASKLIKNFEDPVQNAGASTIKEASQQMGDKVGDGSTTVVAILISLIEESYNLLRSNYSSNVIQKALTELSFRSHQIIEEISMKIDANGAELEKIAHIASNGDKSISTSLSSLLKKLGEDGVIIVEDSRTGDDSNEIREGFYFDKGPASLHFFKPEEQRRMKCELESPLVLVINEKVNSITPYLQAFNQFAQSGKSIVIVAEDFDNDVLNILLLNNLRGIFKVMCIKAPGFGDKKQDFLSDLAIITGAALVGATSDITPEQLNLSHLGSAKKVIIFRENTTFICADNNSADKINRIESIKTMIINSSSEYDKDKLKERLARLTNGIGVLYIGGKTEIEITEKKERIEDAIHACKNALKGGIVPGAGTEFLWIAYKISQLKEDNEVIQVLKILTRKTLPIVTKQIVKNTEKASSDVILNEINNYIKNGSYEYGFNGNLGTVENILQSGIINPSLVAIKAIEIATSIAIKFVNIGSVIYEENQEIDKKPMNDMMY